MAMPRRLSATLELTQYYHCTSRCVRGGYLCGVDRSTGADYTHRRVWLRDRLLFLADTFSIQLAAFAIMENHFHAVLHVDQSAACSWSDEEVVHRWHKLFKGTYVSQRFANSEALDPSQKDQLTRDVARWRDALQDISWFMRCAKEPLARRSNREDGCTGRFWEGRFHSQALLDAQAVIACMVYVDLNPVRAQLCELPEEDPFTSLSQRLRTFQNTTPDTKALTRLGAPRNAKDRIQISLSLEEYATLVDNSARQRRSDKAGVLSNTAKPILERLGFNDIRWRDLEDRFTRHFHVLVGHGSSIRQACNKLGQRYAWGQSACDEFFGEPAS